MIAQINREYIQTRFWKLYSRFVSYALFEGRPLTTKGRWFNTIVFFILRFIQFLPFAKKVEKPTFIIGTGRSGTTILGIVLSMHRKIGYLNEPKAIWHEICKKEDIIGNYTDEVGNYRLEPSLLSEKSIKKAHKIYGHYLNFSFSNRVVDKYPELVFRTEFVNKIFPDAKFIFLIRDGWDTVLSINSWSQRLGTENSGEIHDWWGKNDRKWEIFFEEILKRDSYFQKVWEEDISNHIDRASLEWIATMREGLKISEANSEIFNLRYEELVQNPMEKLQEISDFLDIEKDEKYLKYGEEILQKVKPKEGVKLHEKIEPLFRETMEKLNYRV